MAAKWLGLVCVLVSVVGLAACSSDDGSGEASAYVKECVAAQQAYAASSGQPAPGAAQLLADCEASEKLGTPLTTPSTFARPSDCELDRRTIQIAIETYYANGGEPGTATEAMLVVAGLLRSESSAFDVAADGQTVMSAPDGICA